MMTDTFSFRWEGRADPDDPSGIALLTVGSESVAIPMNHFEKATKLRRLVEKACNRSKEQAINRAVSGISELLKNHLYD
jgi:hypothetical protein